MRDPKRIERILGKLRQLWLSNPDQRLGQLVENLANQPNAFFIEDDRMEKKIDEVLARGWSGAL